MNGEFVIFILVSKDGYGNSGFPAWGIKPGAILEFTLECMGKYKRFFFFFFLLSKNTF